MQSILETAEEIDFKDPACIKGTNINLYQHVARGLNGGDYFVINSQFTSDSGASSKDPLATFNADSSMKFTPMIFNGTTYEQMRPVILDSPFEGDSVSSSEWSQEPLPADVAAPVEALAAAADVAAAAARGDGDTARGAGMPATQWVADTLQPAAKVQRTGEACAEERFLR